jgi:hypothetical protein
MDENLHEKIQEIVTNVSLRLMDVDDAVDALHTDYQRIVAERDGWKGAYEEALNGWKTALASLRDRLAEWRSLKTQD